MKRYLFYLNVLGLLFLGSCTKNNYIDSGISNGRHDCSLLEYMERHSYDWDSTALMVRRAGTDVVALFEGNDVAHSEITFIGFTNHSIRRYLLQNGLKCVNDLTPEFCREQLLRCVVDGKYYRKDFPEGKPISGALRGEGGMDLTALAGNKIWVYSFQQAYKGVEGIGEIVLFMQALTTRKSLTIASADIEPNNCVVHALHYDYNFGDM